MLSIKHIGMVEKSCHRKYMYQIEGTLGIQFLIVQLLGNDKVPIHILVCRIVLESQVFIIESIVDGIFLLQGDRRYR